MKQILNPLMAAGLYLAVFSNPLLAQNFPVVHWINDTGQDGATVLNTNGVFITDFKAHNDVVVTRLTADEVFASWDTFGGTSPGNNPAYLTNYVGAASNGTGNGTAGYLVNLNLTSDGTGSVQFDFLSRLTSQDRVLMIDVDGPEQYLLQGYVFDGQAYVSASITNWTAENYSGSTGVMPDTTWPTWNPGAGILVSGTSANLDEELVVLKPAQNQGIDRLVITKQNGAGWSTDLTFISVVPVAPTLAIQRSGTNVVLSWSNPAFSLQTAPAMTGAYVNVSGATSPYTNSIAGSQQFFRLQSN